jgi:carbamoyl-phosphate synthase large subunit
MRRKAVETAIPCLTSLDTANALANSLKSHYSQENTELVDINNMRSERLQLNFSKMQSSATIISISIVSSRI